MTKEKRLEYLVSTMCVLLTGFIIYGLVGSIEPRINGSKLQSFLLFGCLGGFGFSMVLSGIILTIRYISKRSFKFKIIASLLWVITFACAGYVGFLFYFPYQIYNVIKILRTSSDEIK